MKKWMGKMVWWLGNNRTRLSIQTVYGIERVERRVIVFFFLYFWYVHLLGYPSTRFLLFHRLKTETRRTAFETTATTCAEPTAGGGCTDSGTAILFLDRGTVVAHTVVGDVLVVHAGLVRD